MRKLAYSFIMIFILFGMASCSNTTTPQQTSSNTTTSEKIEISTENRIDISKDKIVEFGFDALNAEWLVTRDGELYIDCENEMESFQNSDEYKQHKYADFITKVVITGNITKIPPLAFKWLDRIKEVTIPDSVEIFEIGCFDTCTALEKINLPPHLKECEFSICASCESLKEITVPGTLTHINNYSFAYCKSLQKAVIMPGVQSLGYDVFDGCTALETLYLPKSVTLIDQYAFRETPLKDIYYEGTQEDFEKITVNNPENESLTRATIHYNSRYAS